jgi:hypothetical protein
MKLTRKAFQMLFGVHVPDWAPYAMADKVGKVFRVEHGMRRCMVCEGLFTRGESQEHAETPCYPDRNDEDPDRGR